MSKLYIEGFESGNMGRMQTYRTDYDFVINKSQLGTITTANGYVDPAQGNYVVAVSDNMWICPSQFVGTEVTEIYLSFKWQHENNSCTESFFQLLSPEGNVHVDFTFDSGTYATSNLQATFSGRTSHNAYSGDWFAPSQWHQIELYYLLSTNSVTYDGEYVLYHDGVPILSESNMRSNVESSATRDIRFIQFDNAGGAYNLYDDIIIDTTSNLSISGAQSIIKYKPSANGTTNQWTAYPSGSNYEVVDEEGSFDSVDADYIRTSQANEKDSYPIVQDGTATVDGTIYSIQTNHRTRKVGNPIINNIEPYIVNGGEHTGTSRPPSINNFNPELNIWEVNPNGGGEWNKAAVEGLEIGVKSDT